MSSIHIKKPGGIAPGGIAAPLVTPLDTAGQIDALAVQKLLATLKPHVDVLMPTLSSGEGWKLDDAQWQAMLEHTLAHADGVPVFPGIIVDEEADFLRRARFAAKAGAAGVTLPVPDHTRHDAAATLARYRHWVGQSPLPVFVYNSEPTDSPERIACLIEICRLPGVVAIKESSRNPAVAQALLKAQVPAAVFQGWEDLCHQSPGVAGYAIALVNLEPALCKAMWQAPDAAQQQQIDRHCQEYDLFADDWYAAIKRTLFARQVLHTEQVLA